MSYYVAVTYDSKRLIPVSRVQFARVVERSGDGRARRRYWRVSLGGTVLPFKGSPDHTGAFHTGSGYPADTPANIQGDVYALGYLRAKLGALAGQFKLDGRWFEITPGDGSQPIRFQPRWGEFRTPNDSSLLVTHAPWEVECETDLISPWDDASVFSQTENPPEEAWELTQADEVGRVWTLTHTVSATGKRRYDAGGNVEAEGWEVARQLILGGSLVGGGASVLGPDAARIASAGVADLSGFAAYNRKRSEVVDEGQGRVQVVETWTLFNPSDTPTGLSGGVALEEYQTETRYGNDTGLTSVTVSGSIAGMDTAGTGAASRWANASARAAGVTEGWAHALAQTESGVTLHPNALATTIARNKLAGTVTYSAQFDNRLAPVGSNILSQVTSVELQNAADIFAALPVPFRAPGPVYQPMGTVGQKAVTVRSDYVVRTTYTTAPVWPSPNHLAKALSYIGTPAQLFLVQDNVSVQEEAGRWSRTSSWVYL